MKPTKKSIERIYTVIFMFVLTFFSISIVAGISLATKDRVDANRTAFEKKAVMAACGLKMPNSAKEIEDWYANSVSFFGNNVSILSINDLANEIKGRVYRQTGKGLWGKIEALIGINEKGEIIGFSVLEQNETPGLGARITEPWFINQLKGKTGKLVLNPEGTRSDSKNEIDAITGATITSKAVLDMLNKAIDLDNSLSKTND